MLEWEVLEDEEGHLPEIEEEAARPARVGWRRWLFALALLLVGSVGFVGGALYAQEQRLRADLSEVITREAHFMALGAREQGEALVDPLAPAEWKKRYRQYLSRAQALPGTPELWSVELQQEETLALVVVAWPPVGDAAAVVERRAYRFYQGQWRRTPLPADAELLETAETEHFVLRAGASDLAVLTEAPAYHERLEAMWQHLNATWVGWEIETYPITIVVQRLEFESVVSYTSSRRMLRANSPRLSYVISNEPLPSRAYYDLQLTRAVLRRVLTFPWRGTWEESIQLQLLDAEARQWMLNEAQRKSLRNSWREALGGQWASPFLPPPVITGESSQAQREAYDRWWLSTALLLDYLIENHGKDVPGRLAHAWLPNPAEFNLQRDLVTLYLSVTGGTSEALEARAREFALTVEE